MLLSSAHYRIFRNFARYSSSVLPSFYIRDVSCANEPVLSYNQGSKERTELIKCLQETACTCEDVPIIIGDKEFRSNDIQHQVMPHNHQHKLARFYFADKNVIKKAIDVSLETRKEWSRRDLQERVKIFKRGADLLSKKYRQKLNAAIMLGQSKTVYQAEIDTAEMIDFARFHATFLSDAAKYEPISVDPKITKNTYRFRGLEGFIAAISPFNFSAIGGNLAYTPALAGNCVLWKPAQTSILSSYVIFQAMAEAGLPPGVVNFVPSDGQTFGDTITTSQDLAGINFTGSPEVFQSLWCKVGVYIRNYHNFPKLSGECGGKNYHFIHPSADINTVVACTIRSAFEYSGQKCSACSRAYIPESLWLQFKKLLLEKMCKIKVGDVCEFSNFTSAVISEASFKKIQSFIDDARDDDDVELIFGGNYNIDVGYFIEPTVIQVFDPCSKYMKEEIFGPFLAIFVYKDNEINDVIELINSSKYALTGAVFAKDEEFLQQILIDAMDSAGNFYINDKSTGAVVAQQPFGGARLSGTNDKPGSPHYVLKFTSPQSIKQTFVPMVDVEYPYMME